MKIVKEITKGLFPFFYTNNVSGNGSDCVGIVKNCVGIVKI